MRIAVFTLAFDPFIGGAELAIQYIAQRLPQHTFIIITVNLDGTQPAREVRGNVIIHRLGSGKKSKYTFPFTAARFARRLHSAQSFDCIWAMMANQAGLAALFFKKHFRAVPYLLSLQEGDSEQAIFWRTFLIRRWYAQIYQFADSIQVLSKFLAQRARQYGYTGQIDIIPNGVEIDHFAQQTNVQSIDQIRQQYDIPGNAFVVVTASRLVHKNAVDVLVRATAQIDTVHLLILGEGQLKDQLSALATELGVADRVHFAGYVSHEDMPKYFAASNIFVRPSRSEGLGSAFLEAMAAGLPIIATPVGGIPDFLRDYETGLFVPVDDTEELVKKIQLLMTSSDLYAALQRGGRQFVAQGYDWDTVASKMNILFKSLCG